MSQIEKQENLKNITQELENIPQENKSLPSSGSIIKSCLVGLSLPVLLYFVYCSPLGKWLKPEQLAQLKSQITLWYIWLPILFWLIGTISIGLGMPRTVLSFFAGNLFGFWAGLGIIELTALTGALIVFCYSRWARNSWIGRPIRKHLGILDAYAQKHGFATIFVLRQTPVPGILVNILLGLSSVKIGTFVIASLIGFLPQHVVFLLYGSGFQDHFSINIALASSILIVLAVFTYYFFQRSNFAKNLVSQLQLSTAEKELGKDAVK